MKGIDHERAEQNKEIQESRENMKKISEKKVREELRQILLP
jgi:hypothetical protein